MSEIEQREVARRKAKVGELKGLLERRVLPETEMELRDQPGRGPILFGHAAVTGVFYDMAGAYREMMMPGFCRRTLGEQPDVVLVANHGHVGSGLPLARTKSSRGGSGTLRLSEDSTGLAFEADLDEEDAESAAIIRKLRRGDLDGQMSFAFTVSQEKWNSDFTDRRIQQVNLHRGDLSIVNQAANQAAVAALRALEHARPPRPIPDYTMAARVRLAERGIALPRRPVRTDVTPEDPYQRRLRELRNP
jgi:HK97 family phage prohead protease